MTQTDDSWRADLAWSVKMMLYIVATFIAVGWLTSCSHKTVESIEWRDSLTVSVRTDTVYRDRATTEKVEEYTDRWRDRLVVVTPIGDTVKDVQKEYIYIEKDTHLSDSLAMYRSMADSLRATGSRTEYVEVRKPPSWREQVQLVAMGIVIGIAAVVLLRRHT